MSHKSTDYPRAMLVDLLEFEFDPIEFGVVHTKKPDGYHITWFDGPSRTKVDAFLKKEFDAFSELYVGSSRRKSDGVTAAR